MTIPNLESVARAVFNAYPADVATLRQVCDETDAFRAQFGEGDPRVQAGEVRANNLKGLFTRRIAWACFQQDARFGLRRKTVGQLATRPSDGLTHATDVLMWKDTGNIVDVMSDRDVSWLQNDADVQPVSEWVAPLPEGVSPAPDPQPVPPNPIESEPPPLLEELTKVIAELAAEVASLRQAVLSDKAIAFPDYTNRFIGSITKK